MDKHVPGQGSTRELEPRQQSQGEGQGSWRATLKAAWRPIFQFNRANLTAFQALRSTLGVALPLIIGISVEMLFRLYRGAHGNRENFGSLKRFWT